MATANIDLYDRAVTHAADLRIHEEKVRVDMERIIRKHQERMRKIAGKGATPAVIRKELTRFKSEVLTFKEGALKEVAELEISFNANNLQEAVGDVFDVKPAKRAGILSRITRKGVRGNKNLPQQVDAILGHQSDRITKFLDANPDIKGSALRAGLVQSSAQTKGQLETLLTTSTTQTQADVFDETMQNNNDVIQGYRFTAVLDSRTSEICAHHDGQVYDIDDKRYVPPLHWNCRSVLVPVTIPHSEMVKSKSSRFDQKKLAKLIPAQIGYLMGRPPAVENYSSWLRRQPTEVQLRHLNGDEDRLAKFQSGTLELDSFTTARGEAVSADTLRKLDNRTVFRQPVRQTAYDPAENHDFVIEAYTVDGLLRSSKAQRQLQELLEIDARNSLSPLSTTDYKGITSKTKRRNRFKANGSEPDELYFDPVTGQSYNPWIYRPNNEVYQERLDIVNKSKVLNDEQKRFIRDFGDRFEDRLSTNQRAVIVDNLRITFERQLNVDADSFGRPWENLTAVIRAENVNAVQNISKRLNVTERRRTSQYVGTGARHKDTPAGIKILDDDKITTFDDIAKNLAANQRYVDQWTDNQGLELATSVYTSGKAPLRTYFLPPSDSNPFDYKKKLIKSLDNAADTANIPARVKKYYKETTEFWLRNPVDVAEDAIRDMARALDEKWYEWFDLETLWRKDKANLRKAIVGKSPKTQKKAIKATASALKVLATGDTTDYDSLAIAIGKQVRKDFPQDFPWWKPGLADHHKNGSRILKHLEDQSLIKVGQATKVRKAPIDISTGRPDPSGYKEVSVREIEITNKELKKLQHVNRQLYVGRRIGLVNERDRLYIKEGELGYYDKFGSRTGEKAITRSASAKLDDEALANHIDREFVQQINYANTQEWSLDNEFAEFMEDIVYYRPRSDRKKPAIPNLYKELVDKRSTGPDGDKFSALFQTIKWHRQNGTNWTNMHQWDGRGRFYEQGYLAATRGEAVRPYLASPHEMSVTARGIQEIQLQIGATIGHPEGRLFKGVDAKLSNEGRIASFNAHIDDILDLGHIQQRKYDQFNRNLDEFLDNSIIRHIDDVDDAAEVPKIARYSLEVKRIEDYLNDRGYSMRTTAWHKQRHSTLRNYLEADNPNDLLKDYKTRLMVENDASASGAQQIALATKDGLLAQASNVIPTSVKNRLYDIAAMDTVADPRFQKRFNDELGLGIQWQDLVKASKAQNMVTFYGAGDATKTMNIENKFAAFLSKNADNIVVYSDKAPDKPNAFSVKELNNQLDQRINQAETVGNMNGAAFFKDTKKELNQMFNQEISTGDKLLRYAAEADDDVADFVRKATNARSNVVTPKDFQLINTIMSDKVAEIAPSTKSFIQFWKETAKTYVPIAANVEIKWVNYRGKELTQVYRPIKEQTIQWYDPVQKRMVTNVYRDVVEDGNLRSASAAGDVATGLGVNGNHMNDASLVQGYWLKARAENKRVATVHDGFFHHLEDADWTIDGLYGLMADGLESRTLEKTIKAMRDAGIANLDRSARRERVKMVDKLIEDLEAGKLTKDKINNAFTIIPTLRDYARSRTGLSDRELSRKLSIVDRKASLTNLRSNIDDGWYSVKAFNDSIKDSPAFERALIAEFGIGREGLLNGYAKHSQRRRLLQAQNKIEAGELTENRFFDNWMKEPALTDVETGRYRNAVKKAREAGQKIPTVSEALGKKPSPQEVLRARYSINSPKELTEAVRDGSFTFEDFFKGELKRTEGALDIDGVKAVISEVFDTQEPDLDLVELAAAFKDYRNNSRREFSTQRKEIETWYENTLNRARELQLIDKNKTNKSKLDKLDKLAEVEKFKTNDLREIYDDWSTDLKTYFGINNRVQLEAKFKSGSFKMSDFLEQQNLRYRELTRADMLRMLREGEDLYGIGP